MSRGTRAGAWRIGAARTRVGYLHWLGRDGPDPDDLPPDRPWGARPSLYDHVVDAIDPATGALRPGREATLPDDAVVAGDGVRRWGPGWRDGLLAQREPVAGVDRRAAEVLAGIDIACRKASPVAREVFYGLAAADDTLTYVDTLLEALSEPRNLSPDRVRTLARWLARRAPDRGAVKLGLALLGLFRDGEDRATMLALGSHDELALFAVVAIGNTQPDAGELLWTVARRCRGWGRVQAVERLPESDDPALRDWLLREGWRNTVRWDLLAFQCATRGGLAAALAGVEIDDELCCAAGELLRGLIAGGPEESLADYDEGADAAERWSFHLRPGPDTLRALPGCVALRDWCEDEAADWDTRADRGWTPGRRSVVASRCEQAVDPVAWRSHVMAACDSGDEARYQAGARAARLLGIDIWARDWRRLRQAPMDTRRWFAVMRHLPPERVPGVVAFAEETLPLDAIAAGPDTEMGDDEAHAPHRCLDALLAHLARFPGQGWSLVRAGLASPVVRNRNLALRALAAWGPAACPPGVRALLRHAEATEPDADVRERIRAVLENRRIE